MRTHSYQNILQLLRVLFPNWGFFDIIGDRFFLYYAVSENQWTKIYFDLNLKPINILVNSNNNLTMAKKNILEHFISDFQAVSDESNLEKLSSYKILTKIVEDIIKKQEQKSRRYKFKVTYIKKSKHQESVLFASGWNEFSSNV